MNLFFILCRNCEIIPQCVTVVLTSRTIHDIIKLNQKQEVNINEGQKIRKKVICIALAAVVVCVAAVCAFAFFREPKLDDETAKYVEEQIITQASQTAFREENDFPTASYKVLKTQKNGDTKEIYLVACYENYADKDGLSVISASSSPLVLTVQKTDNGYELKEYWKPGMGTDFETSINERFPKSVRSKALDSDKYSAELKLENLQKAAAHYGTNADNTAQDDTQYTTKAYS